MEGIDLYVTHASKIYLKVLFQKWLLYFLRSFLKKMILEH